MLPGIIEGKLGEEDLENESELNDEQVFNKVKNDDDGSSGKMDSSNSESDSGDSSIDMDGDADDEDKMYQKMLGEQNKADTLKDAKDKGQHLDDLVDKEMIELLNVCKRLHMPKLETM